MRSASQSPARIWLWVCLAATVFCVCRRAEANNRFFRCALVRPAEVTSERLRDLAVAEFHAIALVVDAQPDRDDTVQQRSKLLRAIELVAKSQLDTYYWIEVARCPELADAHPTWMASLQTHDEWRRYFPESPLPAADEVAKTYPWVPIMSREPYLAQLARVRKLLEGIPEPIGLFLNDLQGAPSACGCGNTLCRWTSDYGPRRTTVPLGDDAATLFVSAIQARLPKARVIPVWTTECEQHDGQPDGLCAGVGCFRGICWKAYCKQLLPLQEVADTIAVLTPFKAFERDLLLYGPKASWVGHAVSTFATVPPQHGGTAIPASRIIAVVQGWDLSDDDIAAQVRQAQLSGAQGCVVAFAEIEQGWEPRIVKWK